MIREERCIGVTKGKIRSCKGFVFNLNNFLYFRQITPMQELAANFFDPQFMKNLLLLIALSLVKLTVFGQAENRQIITPEMELKFKTEIEKQVPVFKKQLLKEEKSNDEIEFTLDTFRINQFVLKRMDVDFTTQGMNYTVRQQAISYDKLMNKYYSKLLTKLSVEDKKVLVSAQKAWVIYRDLESKLIWRMTDSQYSGGGTIQTNFATDACAELIIKRTQEIFNYYLTIVEVEAR